MIQNSYYGWNILYFWIWIFVLNIRYNIHNFAQHFQAEYLSKYGGSVIPVRINDVMFASHNLCVNTVCFLQIFVYEVKYWMLLLWKKYMNIPVSTCQQFFKLPSHPSSKNTILCLHIKEKARSQFFLKIF